MLSRSNERDAVTTVVIRLVKTIDGSEEDPTGRIELRDLGSVLRMQSYSRHNKDSGRQNQWGGNNLGF